VIARVMIMQTCRHLLSLCMVLIGVSAARVFASSNERGTSLHVTMANWLVSQSVVQDLPAHLHAFVLSDGSHTSDLSLVSLDALSGAVKNSGGWIRALLRSEYVPDNLEEHINGVVNSVNVYDATRVRFESNGIHFLVTQTASHINIVVRSNECVLEWSDSTPINNRMSSLSTVIKRVFRKAGLILHMSNCIEEIPSGVAIRVRTLSEVNSERTAERERLILELRRIDDTLPRSLRAGPFYHWWGTVYAVTDGCTLVLHARKCTGGGSMADLVKDWFRKERLPGSHIRFSPEPPKLRSPQ